MRSIVSFLIVAGAYSLSASGAEPAARGAAALQQPPHTARAGVLGKAAIASVEADKGRLGLGGSDSFSIQELEQDGDGNTFIRLQQYYKGVPVWGGSTVHCFNAAGKLLYRKDSVKAGIDMDPAPTLTGADAMAVRGRRGVTLDLQNRPLPDLWVFPVKGEGTAAVPIYKLVYRILGQSGGTESGEQPTSLVLLDAHSGAPVHEIKSRPRRAAASGVGYSPFYEGGNVALPLATDSISGGYQLLDTVRGINTTMASLGDTPTLTPFISGSNTWGVAGGATNSQTIGVEAHYGAYVGHEMFKNVMGRNTITVNGHPVGTRIIPYQANIGPAYCHDGYLYFSDDNEDYNRSTHLDLVVHELSHALVASQESSGYATPAGEYLEESFADAMGQMAQSYYRGYYRFGPQGGTTIPDADPDWSTGLPFKGYSDSNAKVVSVRFFKTPHLDQVSPNYYTEDVENLDSHYGSGPFNRCFYFLSQGAGSSDSKFLPGGMTGIGNHKAATIFYRAYLWMGAAPAAAGSTGAYDFKARAVEFARVFYGEGSAEHVAVQKAFAAIGVAPASFDSTAPVLDVSLFLNWRYRIGYLGIQASASDNVGVTKVEFYVGGALVRTFTAPPYTYNKMMANGTYDITVKAFDAAMNQTEFQSAVEIYPE